MDALVCLDMAHQWRVVETGPNKDGKYLTGCPRTVKLCMVCGSLKTEIINWRGYVIYRQYTPGEAYIENARKLSGDVHERRAVYRRLRAGRVPKGVCEKCWIVHDSVDCPIEPFRRERT
jgi:hypothetical protein